MTELIKSVRNVPRFIQQNAVVTSLVRRPDIYPRRYAVRNRLSSVSVVLVEFASLPDDHGVAVRGRGLRSGRTVLQRLRVSSGSDSLSTAVFLRRVVRFVPLRFGLAVG
jgi:hypothetical protein